MTRALESGPVSETHCTVYNDAQCVQQVSTFCQFFVDKVRHIQNNILAALQSSASRTFAVRQYLGTELSVFEPTTTEKVRKLSGMPSKSSPLNVLPCSLLKSCAHVFAPVIARLANLSLQCGKFPTRYNRVQVLPLLKKARLDSSLPVNYRLISNLSIVSKVLERLIFACLQPHLLGSSNFSEFQSAYRKGHSTETALQEVMDGAFTVAVNKQFTVLIGLDLLAAFDTVDHRLLLSRLRLEFGVMETPLNWLQSDLEGQTQFVKMGQYQSAAIGVDIGVPLGSVLGPLLFAVYCSPVATSSHTMAIR